MLKLAKICTGKMHNIMCTYSLKKYAIYSLKSLINICKKIYVSLKIRYSGEKEFV